MKKVLIVVLTFFCFILLIGCGQVGRHTAFKDAPVKLQSFNEFSGELLSTNNPAINVDNTLVGNVFDWCVFFTADNKTMYFTSTRPGGEGREDVWRSDFVGGVWTEPTTAGLSNINTAEAEYVTYLSPDGKKMYISSDHDYGGGQGQLDLWVSTLNGTTWSTPVNLGVPINSADWEYGCFEMNGGNTLYFSRQLATRPDNDFWYSEKAGGVWQTPKQDIFININSDTDEYYPIYVSTTEELFFSSERQNQAGDYAKVYKSKLVKGVWSFPIYVDSEMNKGVSSNVIVSYVSPDTNTIYVATDRRTSASDNVSDLNIWKYTR